MITLSQLLSKMSPGFKDLLGQSGRGFSLVIAGQLLSFCFAYLVSSRYGAVTMGNYALGISFSFIPLLAGHMGLPNAIVRLTAEYESSGHRNYIARLHRISQITVLVLSAVLAISFAVASPWLTRSVFHNAELTPFLVLALLSIMPKNVASIWSCFLQGLGYTTSSIFLRKVLIPTISIVSMVVLGFFDVGSPSPAIAHFSASLFFAATAGFMFMKKSSWPTRRCETARSLPDSPFAIAWPLLLSMVAVQLIGEADKLMLGAMTTPESVGVYTVAHKIALFSLLPMWTVGEACKPRFASLMKNAEQASLEKFVHQASLLMFSSSLPLLAVLYIVAETVLRVFGEEFVSGAAVLRILLVGEAVAAACGPAGPLLNMTGHHRAVRNTLFAGLLINILANSILIPRFGLIGAATASTTARIAWNITFAAHVHKTHRITTVALFIPLISRR